MSAELFAFKFIISDHEWKTSIEKPDIQYQGCVAVAIAPDEESARRHLERYSAENGLGDEWLPVARVVKLPLVDGACLAWAEV